MGTAAGGSVDVGELRYVRLQKEHLAAIFPLEHEAYPDPWTQGMFLQEIRNATSHFYLAFWGEQLVAYGGFWLILDEIHITKLTVAPAFRGHGLGRVLMGFLEQQGWQAGGRVVRLEVRASNTPARRLYAGLGYQEVGVRKNYYTASREDAIVMARDFLAPPGGRTPAAEAGDFY